MEIIHQEIMERFSTQEVQDMQDTFKLFDQNGDGHITLQELGKVIKTLFPQASPADLQVIIDTADIDGNGEIEFDEFVRLVGPEVQRPTTMDDYRKAFKAFDLDGDGYITMEELMKIMSAVDDRNFQKVAAQEMMQEADLDGDGRISYDEFVQYLTKQGPF